MHHGDGATAPFYLFFIFLTFYRYRRDNSNLTIYLCIYDTLIAPAGALHKGVGHEMSCVSTRPPALFLSKLGMQPEILDAC